MLTTVSEYLIAARQAHAEYRSHAGTVTAKGEIVRRKDPVKCHAAILEAITARGHALALDPAQADPAWAEDRALNRGATNDQMLAFYDKVLMTC